MKARDWDMIASLPRRAAASDGPPDSDGPGAQRARRRPSSAPKVGDGDPDNGADNSVRQ